MKILSFEIVEVGRRKVVKKSATRCPYEHPKGTGKMYVGSYLCTLCKSFVSRDIENAEVVCIYPNKNDL